MEEKNAFLKFCVFTRLKGRFLDFGSLKPIKILLAGVFFFLCKEGRNLLPDLMVFMEKNADFGFLGGGSVVLVHI